MIDKPLFISAITALTEQHDKDAERANVLSEIYGADIDPVDNNLLRLAVFNLLASMMGEIRSDHVMFWCYDQDFGRGAGKSIEDLWEELGYL